MHLYSCIKHCQFLHLTVFLNPHFSVREERNWLGTQLQAHDPKGRAVPWSLPGFQSISGRRTRELAAPGSAARQMLLLQWHPLLSWSFLTTILLVLWRSWLQGLPDFCPNPQMPWPDLWQHSRTCEDTGAKAEGSLEGWALWCRASIAELRLCSPNSLHPISSFILFPCAAYPGLLFHSAGSVAVSVMDRQSPSKGINGSVRLYLWQNTWEKHIQSTPHRSVSPFLETKQMTQSCNKKHKKGYKLAKCSWDEVQMFEFP